MNGAIPWRELREKDLLLLKMLIEASIEVDDIVVDCIVATGDSLPLSFMIFHSRLFTMQLSCYFDFARASIHACRKAIRNIVAMYEDEVI
jgi:hypothetical protein